MFARTVKKHSSNRVARSSGVAKLACMLRATGLAMAGVAALIMARDDKLYVLDAQTQNGDEPVGEYSFSVQSCLSSANSC